MARILTGIQSSGIPHLGNLLGAIMPAIELSRDRANDSLFFIADLHSITTVKDGTTRRINVDAVAATWIALGFDYDQNMLYRQSDLPEVCELTWYLSCFVPFPMLQNAHSFKDKSDKLSDVNAGLFTYPVLMTADILLYDANVVPVGKDQQQHLEMARDTARAVNFHYQTEVFVVPEAKIDTNVMTVPGTDGQKMSKSYGNFIDVFQDPKAIKKQVAGIITDASTLDEPKDPELSTVYKLFRLVASAEAAATMAEKYAAGGYGHGHAKAELTEALVAAFAPARERYNQLMANPDEIDRILAQGADKARSIGAKTLDRVRSVMGTGPRKLM